MTYDAIIKRLHTQLQRESKIEDEGELFLFCEITGNRIIKITNSRYEVLFCWKNVSITWEPISVIQRDDSIYLARYPRDHNILDNTVWKQLRQYVNKTKKMNRLLKYYKAKKHRNSI